MRTQPSFLIVVLLLFVAGCASPLPGGDTITQVSTIDALLAGAYDGDTPCAELLRYGDTGIGTFDDLEGEMVVLDAKLYQVKADGGVYTPPPVIETPFAAVCRFQSDMTVPLEGRLRYDDLREQIDGAVPNKNVFCAVTITGTFSHMKTRSVPAQKKPYPPLVEVTKHQSEFLMADVEGTIVGFRCPPYVKGINVPGYHLHFISADRRRGGHVLEFEMVSGRCDVDVLNKLYVVLPADGASLKDIDLSRDRGTELEQVE